MTLTVVCWKWKPKGMYRSHFGPESVHALQRMVERHYRKPHRFVCVTDDPTGLDCETIPLWDDYADVPSPHGRGNPSCYRRLKAFDPDVSKYFGDRFVSLDLDTVIVNDVSPLWDRDEDFVIWRDPYNPKQYCGSMFLLRSGFRPKVWSEFDPVESPKIAKVRGFMGSDQAWISYSLPNEPVWTGSDGAYSYGARIGPSGVLPFDARIVFFHGRVDPWSPTAQRLDWVRDHWGTVQ